MNPFYVSHTWSGCEYEVLNETALSLSGSPLQAYIKFIDIFNLVRSLNYMIRLKFETDIGSSLASYITTSYFFAAPPTLSTVLDSTVNFIENPNDHCYDFNHSLSDNYGATIAGEEGEDGERYTINLSDYSEQLSAGLDVNITLSVDTKQNLDSQRSDCSDFGPFYRRLTLVSDLQADCLDENQCRAYKNRALNFNATSYECSFDTSDSSCSCNDPLRSGSRLTECTQVTNLLDSNDCFCSYDNPTTRFEQSLMFQSQATNLKVEESQGNVQVYYSSSNGLYADDENQIVSRKAEYYIVRQADEESDDKSGIYTLKLNTLMGIWDAEQAQGTNTEQHRELKLYAWEFYEELHNQEEFRVFRKPITIKVNRNFVNSSLEALCNDTLTQN